MLEVYEYAGFQYYVIREGCQPIRMDPVEDQHPAASKEKHRRAALDCLIQDEERNSKPETSK